MMLHEKKINEKKRKLFIMSTILWTFILLGDIVFTRTSARLQTNHSVAIIDEIDQSVDTEKDSFVDVDDMDIKKISLLDQMKLKNNVSDTNTELFVKEQSPEQTVGNVNSCDKDDAETTTTQSIDVKSYNVAEEGKSQKNTAQTENKTTSANSNSTTNNQTSQSTVKTEKPIKNAAQTQVSNVGKVDTPIVEKKPCVSHDLSLVKTTVIESYQLYSYVTDCYKCNHCNYQESRDHIASANISSSTIANAEAEVVAAVNKLRAENGLSQLWTDSTWNAWADQRANSIATNYTHGGWTHKEGNTYTLAENITSGQASSSEIYTSFLNSAQHKSAMLQKNAVGIAIGIYVTEDGSTYCAMSIIAEK